VHPPGAQLPWAPQPQTVCSGARHCPLPPRPAGDRFIIAICTYHCADDAPVPWTIHASDAVTAYLNAQAKGNTYVRCPEKWSLEDPNGTLEDPSFSRYTGRSPPKIRQGELRVDTGRCPRKIRELGHWKIRHICTTSAAMFGRDANLE